VGWCLGEGKLHFYSKFENEVKKRFIPMDSEEAENWRKLCNEELYNLYYSSVIKIS
jgi:hypothetical protein